MVPVEPLTSAPLVQIARSLRRRHVSPVELTDAFTRRIEAAAGLGAYITLPDERARREAQRAQRRLAHGEAGALLGVPIAVKDLFQTRALRTTAGSRILRDWVPTRDADAVTRLRAAGAIIFGKTNLHEFDYGVTTANPWWGVARNPHDPRRSPGGSSGGSAIAVVAGLLRGRPRLGHGRVDPHPGFPLRLRRPQAHVRGHPVGRDVPTGVVARPCRSTDPHGRRCRRAPRRAVGRGRRAPVAAPADPGSAGWRSARTDRPGRPASGVPPGRRGGSGLAPAGSAGPRGADSGDGMDRRDGAGDPPR